MAGIKRRKYNQEYHSKNKEKIKIIKREKFLKKQKIRLEKILLKNPNPPSKKCRICGTDMYYSNISQLNASIKANRVCNSCKFTGVNNPAFQKPPHNKGKYKRTENERKIFERNRQLKRNFGISDKEYKELFDSQNGKCKICGIPQNELNKNLCVDHCHKSNKIRGLLCRKCNAGLGIFKDNIDIINSALKYLQSS